MVGIALFVHAGDQNQSEDRDGEGDDDDEEGDSHPADDDPDGVVGFHRGLALGLEGVSDKERDRDDVGEKGTAGKRNNGDGALQVHLPQNIDGEGPDSRRGDELNIGDQAGSQQDRAQLGFVTELEDGSDEVDDDGGEEFVAAVVFDIGRVAVHETEVDGHGEDEEKAGDDFLGVHGRSLRINDSLRRSDLEGD